MPHLLNPLPLPDYFVLFSTHWHVPGTLSKGFRSIIPFSLHDHHYPHFTDEYAEALVDEATWPKVTQLVSDETRIGSPVVWFPDLCV